MRLIARTLIILIAALLVCGATYALAGSRYAQTAFPARAGRGENAAGRPSAFTPGATDGTGNGVGRPQVPGGERGGPGGFGAIEVLKNLAIVAVIVAIGTPILRLTRRRAHPAARAAALSDTPMASDEPRNARASH
jgi:hypothetical protein